MQITIETPSCHWLAPGNPRILPGVAKNILALRAGVRVIWQGLVLGCIVLVFHFLYGGGNASRHC